MPPQSYLSRATGVLLETVLLTLISKFPKSTKIILKGIYIHPIVNKKCKETFVMEQIKVEMKPAGISMEVDKQEFALALKTWRLRNGLTQKQVGERWGCSRYTILRAEGARNLTWEMAYRLFAKLSNELRKEAENG